MLILPQRTSVDLSYMKLTNKSFEYKEAATGITDETD
jgi:hypothetical protein